MVNNTNASLAEVLKQEVENKGIGILNNQYLVNILADYLVFKEQPALKNIIKSMQDNGFIEKITSANIWSIDSKSLAKQFARENGFQTDLVLYVVKSLGYAMSKEHELPVLTPTTKGTKDPIVPLEIKQSPSKDDLQDGNMDLRYLDPLFTQVAHAVVVKQIGSTSRLQRDFAIGYNKAGCLMDQLEKVGIVGEACGSKPRKVLVKDEATLNNILASLKLTKGNNCKSSTSLKVQTKAPKEQTKERKKINGCLEWLLVPFAILFLPFKMGWSGCLIIFLVVGFIGGLVDRCDKAMGGNSSEQASTNDSVFYLPRTIVDTTRDTHGEIIDMKQLNVHDVKLTFAPETLYLETPYNCPAPSLTFAFDDEVFNRVTKKLQKVHNYVLTPLQMNSKHHIYYILKKQLPKIEYEGTPDTYFSKHEEGTDDYFSDYGSTCSFEILYPRGDSISFNEGEIHIDDYVKGYELSDSLKTKLFDYLKTVKNK